MAARFAVTTGNWTDAIWAATSGGAAGSAAVPTAADDVTINKNVTVTIDDATAVANTVTLSNGTTGADVGAILTCTTSANWKLTIENGLTAVATSNPSNTATYTSSVLFDMSAAPTYTGELVVNNVHGTTTVYGNVQLYGNYLWKGAPRKRHSVIESALTAASTTSVYVTDATGWRVDDVLIFATTSAYNATPRTDRVVIDSITFDNAPTNTGRAQITWSESLAYDHANGCPVGNFTSNLIFRPSVNNERSCVVIASAINNQSIDCYMSDVAFGARIGGVDYGCWATQSPGGALFFSMPNGGSNAGSHHKGITSNSFYEYRQGGLCGNYLNGYDGDRNFNIFYTSHASGSAACMWSNITGRWACGPEEDYAIFRSISGIQRTTTTAPLDYPGNIQRRHKISGIIDQGSNGVAISASFDVEDCDMWSNYHGLSLAYGAVAYRCRFNESVFPNATKGLDTVFVQPGAYATLVDCEMGTSPSYYDIGTVDSRKITVVNKNPAANGAALQEVFQYQSTTVPAVQRNTATVNRSTSSLEFTLNTTTAQTYAFEVLAKAGQTIKLLTYVRKSGSPAYGASTLPSVTVSGLGITPVVSTMSGGTAADTWELLTTEATNTGSADGLLTVTLTAQSSTAGAKAFFAGLPAAPFVSRCRHYGYLFDETIPTRTANITVSANEATAAAYTGMTVTGGVSVSPVQLTLDQTFQKLYDYTQAWSCLDVGYAVPLTGAGVAGSPALFAAANVTIDTAKKLNGSGSISMGSYTLTTETAGAQAYTYTGGAWSQATTVPTFNGGTLNIGAAETFEFDTTGTVIVSMTPSGASTYAMEDVTANGVLDLRNTTAHAITVELTAEVAALAITSNNPGGTITISAPQVYQSVTISGAVAGSRIQIYDTDAATELYNGTPAFPYTWTDGTPAAADRPIRLRVAKVSTVTASNFIEANIGTCATSGAGKDISYLVAQTDDDTYNTNAIDGSTVADVTFTDAATDLVVCNIVGGAVTWPSIYAAFVYWLSTATGIADDITYISAPDTANYLLTSMMIRNTSATPLKITGGYGRDATSGLVADIIDVAGSTGNIYPSPDHVVPFSTGSGLTAGQDAALTAAESAATNAASYALEAKYLLRNKRVIDPATGIETVYDDAGVALYTRDVFVDAAGTVSYNGTAAPHRVERYA